MKKNEILYKQILLFVASFFSHFLLSSISFPLLRLFFFLSSSYSSYFSPTFLLFGFRFSPLFFFPLSLFLPPHSFSSFPVLHNFSIFSYFHFFLILFVFSYSFIFFLIFTMEFDVYFCSESIVTFLRENKTAQK